MPKSVGIVGCGAIGQALLREADVLVKTGNGQIHMMGQFVVV